MKKIINNLKGKAISRISRIATLLLILSMLSAGDVYCITDPTEIKTPATSIQGYNYKWVGKSDPFKPFIETNPSIKKNVEKAPGLLPISPLQRLELAAIKLVGIAGDDKTKKGVIEDMHGKFYPVHVGTYIGTNNGIIKEILADRIIVEERSKVLGKVKAKLITMKLHQEENEGKP
jgi:Tfp pilus assembly protein PilP